MRTGDGRGQIQQLFHDRVVYSFRRFLPLRLQEIGVVALGYHHMGTAVDYRVELSSWSLPGNP